MKIISRRLHGVADYSLVVALLSLPAALGLTGSPRAICYSLAFVHLLVTGFSSFPLGPFPVIPLRVHGYLEILAAALLIASPWLFQFSNDAAARNSFLAIGILVAVLFALTNYDRRERPQPRPPGDRRRWFERRS